MIPGSSVGVKYVQHHHPASRMTAHFETPDPAIIEYLKCRDWFAWKSNGLKKRATRICIGIIWLIGNGIDNNTITTTSETAKIRDVNIIRHLLIKNCICLSLRSAVLFARPSDRWPYAFSNWVARPTGSNFLTSASNWQQSGETQPNVTLV